MEELIAKRYVQALLDISDKKEKSKFAETINAIAETFSDPKVAAMIDAPIVSDETKVNAILDALGKKANEKLVNLIKILGENKRLSLIPAISKILNADMQKESNEYEGVVKSFETLEKDALDELENTLKRYTGSSIKLKQEKSETEGLKVSVEDLGIEVNFSKERVKEDLIDFIKKAL